MKVPVWAEVVSKNTIKAYFESPVALGDTMDIKLTVGDKEEPFVIAMKDMESNEATIVLKKDLQEEDLSKDIFFESSEGKLRVYPTQVLDEFTPDINEKLGNFIENGKTVFRLWSPVAKSVKLLLFKNYSSENPENIYDMVKRENGIWEIAINKNLDGWFYLYEIDRLGKVVKTVDIYSKSVSINGEKSAVVNLSKSNPEGWEEDKPVKLKAFTDAIVYEIHIADITALESSGVDEKLRGKYLGVVQESQKGGVNTAFSHLKELGITHVQIMPLMIFRSCKEDDENCYSWGYDPCLYMVPSGKYSTDPYDPYKRLKELKEMIKKLHENGFGVILDIVFPHTHKTGKESPFDATVPFYYYRIDSEGNYIDETACGNTTNSERKMMRKLMIDTVKYWLEEFHVDGFRFDQMGVIDIEAMEMIVKAARSVNENALIYGEPWGGNSDVRIYKGVQKNKEFGVFNDDIRDSLRGSVFKVEKRGFVMAHPGFERKLSVAILGSPDYLGGFTKNPHETINYVECHDNHTLFDKNTLTAKLDDSYEWTLEDLKAAQKLAGGVILTSLGIPFIQLGQDFCRTKNFNPNSYNAPIEINGIDWNRKKEFFDVFKYHKGLVQLRKEHPAFRAYDPDEIRIKAKILRVQELFIV
ncbi:MAG: type I pullulanase, partial [Thermotogaceae bacterium]|nr:type I pullulanase [Thermotogaceae bacterium]